MTEMMLEGVRFMVKSWELAGLLYCSPVGPEGSSRVQVYDQWTEKLLHREVTVQSV